MTYRKYFSDNQTQRQFFDSIAGQVTRRTMSADDQGLFVEYETREESWYGSMLTKRGFSGNAYGQSYYSNLPDSGQLSNFALPLAIAGIALYALHYMVASGIIGSLTMLGR